MNIFPNFTLVKRAEIEIFSAALPAQVCQSVANIAVDNAQKLLYIFCLSHKKVVLMQRQGNGVYTLVTAGALANSLLYTSELPVQLNEGRQLLFAMNQTEV